MNLCQREVRLLIVQLLGTPPVCEMVQDHLDYFDVGLVNPGAPIGVGPNVACGNCFRHNNEQTSQFGSIASTGQFLSWEKPFEQEETERAELRDCAAGAVEPAQDLNGITAISSAKCYVAFD
jgi:hypothetical protein